MDVADPMVTPEAVALELEPSTVGARGVAILLDYLIIGTGLLLLTAAEAAVGVGGHVPGWLGLALLLLLVFALQLGYPIGFETLWRGRTPGKAAMGLRVVTQEGAPVGFRHAAIRAAAGLLELQGTMGGVAVIASLASPRAQRLGDLAAGTLVVRERRAAGVPRAIRFEAPAGLEAYVRALDTSGLDTADYATIRDLLRRPMEPHIRERLAREVANALVGRVRPPPPAGVDPVRWLQALAAAVQGPSAPGDRLARRSPPTRDPSPSRPPPGPDAPPTGAASPPSDDPGFAPPA